MKELLRRIAFSRIRGINVTTARLMADVVGGVDSFFDLPQGELWQIIGAQKDFCSDNARTKALEEAKRELEFINSKNIHVLWHEDGAYPERLRQCEDAPVILYKVGQCDLNAAHVISVVGTRNATSYGLQATKAIINELHEAIDNLIVVSGLAYGIDVQAHRASLTVGVPTVGVVAHGLNTIYPAEHRNVAGDMIKKGGSVVTEYMSGDRIHKGNFLARNRIVAGMCDVLVVAESDIHGGALVTARLASDYDREVCALPGRIIDRYSRGCNALIAENRAHILRSADDIIELMGWEKKALPGEQKSFDFGQITEEMRQIVDHLRKHPDHQAGEIASALGVPYPTMSSRLMEMELDDLIIANPGGTFTLNI